jgi:conjugal transfer pilus assembly protein TraB
VTSDVRESRAEQRQLRGEVARLKAQVDRYTQAEGEGAANKDERLDSELASLRAELEQLKNPPRNQLNPPGTAGNPVPGIAEPPAPPPPPAYGPIRTIGDDNANTNTSSPAPQASNVSRTVAAPAEVPKFYMPSGSVIQAVLLTGVDAPTGRAALKDPVPVLARIKHQAILPNRFLADVRECFLLLDTVGDLPSERAMMRSANISCVRKDRSVIDVPIQGYAVGEDGRAGLRGRVVSKQGAALGKAMMAGFADGVSRAFGANNSSLSTGGDINASQSMQSGAMGGASTALDRVAQYYLDLANEMHPIIEIDRGRHITLVVVRGRTLATIDPNTPQTQLAPEPASTRQAPPATTSASR